MSYMQVVCFFNEINKKEGIVESCYVCKYKTKCDAYALIMDLTAEREICPLDRHMEECVKTGRRVLGKCELEK